MNEIVKHEESSPFLDKLKEEEFFDDHHMLNYVKDFIRHVRKGSQTHLNSIIPLLQLTNKLPSHMKIGNAKQTAKREIEEAEYNVSPPEGL
jgi:hypothetical protein